MKCSKCESTLALGEKFCGEPAGKTSFYAMVGPTGRYDLVYLSGTTTQDWDTMEDLFIQIAQGIQDRE